MASNATPPQERKYNMKEFTTEMLNAVTEANNSVKGTREYNKFHMAATFKNEKGKWFSLDRIFLSSI